jgi:ketosteroid isomerase-like protein
VTIEDAWKLAEHWIAAWNAHDLDQIMTHYEDAIELIFSGCRTAAGDA